MFNIYSHTQVPVTSTVVSYAYTISVNGKPIGTIQGFNPTSTRTTERIHEIQNVHKDTVEIVPGRTEIKITIDRMEIYTQHVVEALGLNPFEEGIVQITQPIDIIETLRDYTGVAKRTTTYANCWISSWAKQITEGTVTVKENVTVECESIHITSLV